ncbi:MAG TPA: hypothetical protein PKD51_16715 [Saprospiraceae bacterium]|nr:hypothetical protein [Saprospiraceae bacterium]
MISRTSKALEISRRRLERLKSIVPTPDFGTGFSIADFESKINELAIMQAEYNKARSDLDAQLTSLREEERELLDYRERILTAIAFVYGKDTPQYVAAGGIRKSERKRPRPRNASSATGSENDMSN